MAEVFGAGGGISHHQNILWHSHNGWDKTSQSTRMAHVEVRVANEIKNQGRKIHRCSFNLPSELIPLLLPPDLGKN